MRIEQRFIPKDRQMILVPETDGEIAAVDSFFGESVETFNSKPINAFLCIDDAFKPYIRIEK